MRSVRVGQSFRSEAKALESIAEKNLAAFKKIEKKLNAANKLITIKRGKTTILTTYSEEESPALKYVDNGEPSIYLGRLKRDKQDVEEK